MYEKCIKRIFDFVISLLMLAVLSPIMVLLILLGSVFMGGNPFFTQKRPGKNEKVFRLIKFRTMDNRKDEAGDLLPDEIRLNRYGRILRSSSLDELPELINILKGDMSFIGPRPLLVQYLELYNEEQKHRHDVMPGLTGYAQVHGRNAISWEDRFAMDVWYAEHISLKLDVQIILYTIKTVLRRDGISAEGEATVKFFEGSPADAKVTWQPPY